MPLTSEEVIHGLGYEYYPEEVLEIADWLFEQTGQLFPQDYVMSFDPIYIRDWNKYRRIHGAVKKKPAQKPSKTE